MKTREAVAELAQRLVDDLIPLVTPFERIPKPVIAQEKEFDEEHFVLCIGDLQAGHKTKSFDFGVLGDRMETLVQKVIKITHLHRQSHPVNNLTIFLLGDLIQSEKIGYLVSLEELEGTVKEQLFGCVIPALTMAIGSFGNCFANIRVVCVRGN